MKRLVPLSKRLSLGCVLVFLLVLSQQAGWGQDSASAIKQVLTDQASAWNRGDIPAFMSGYKNSPETTFVGKTVQHGWQKVLERYEHSYPSKDAMGTLDFSELEVRTLGQQYAVATGKYHLARSVAGGGDASGIFSLVFEKTAAGWKIILDHTS